VFQERPVERTDHDSQADPYAWLRDRDDPRVRAHIAKENNFTDERLAPIRALQEKIRQEILDRVDLDQASVPVRWGVYEYYSRTEQNQPYTIHCRRRAQAGAPEEIILDENVLANGKGFFAVEFSRVSPDQSRCVFGVDTIGDERPLLFVKDLNQEGASVALAGRAVSDAAWANDNRTFFSVQLDDRNRPFRLARHSISLGIGSQPSLSEHVVFEEHDESFRLRLTRTESGRS
jgi:oligopeptidase B